MNIHQEDYVIISAHKETNSVQENARLQASLACDLLNLIGFDTWMITVEGEWQGVQEEAFAVVLPEHDTPLYKYIQNGIIDLGNKYNQLFLLVVYQNLDAAPYPVAGFIPLERSVEHGYSGYKACPWIEVHNEIPKNVRTAGLTRIQGRCFVADLDNVTHGQPIITEDECIMYLADALGIEVNMLDANDCV